MTRELTPGDELEPRRIESVRAEDMRLLAAILQDPYPPHFDRRGAAERGYPGLLNQGPANCSYLLQAVVRVLDSPTDIHSLDLRFRDMVFEGESVTATATVTDIRDGDAGDLGEFAVALEKEDGTVAVEGSVTARLPTG